MFDDYKPEPEQAAKPKVLVIEGTKEFRKSAIEALSGICELEVAPCLSTAIKKIEKRVPDFIISGIEFPRVRGSSTSDNILPVLEYAMLYAIPVAVVTRHTEQTRMDNELQKTGITLLTLEDMAIFLTERYTIVKEIIDRQCETYPENKKTQKVWTNALSLLRNENFANEMATGLNREIRSRRAKGEGVVILQNQPKIRPFEEGREIVRSRIRLC